MSCYHPLLGYKIGINPSGKPKYEIVPNYAGVADQEIAKKFDGYTIVVPCGHCIGCRLDKSREWADRMMLELQHTGKAVFLTLTYSNEGLDPENRKKLETMSDDGCVWFDDFAVPELSLRKRDYQLFMKRLRKYFEPTELRFYASGEYGEATHRPHYHAIIFGISLQDIPGLQYRFSNEFGDPIYSSDVLEYDIWKKGMVRISDVSWKTCAYVARYVMKKQYGSKRTDAYDMLNVEQPFGLMSRRPGIAGYYYTDDGRIFDPDKVNEVIVDHGEQRKISIPKYFIRKLEESDPEKYNELKKQRRTFAIDRELLKLSMTDLSLIELYEQEENRKAGAVKNLIRPVDKLL